MRQVQIESNTANVRILMEASAYTLPRPCLRQTMIDAPANSSLENERVLLREMRTETWILIIKRRELVFY